MTRTYLPPTWEIHALFIDEVIEMGCVYPDVHDDGARLYARAVFSAPIEVRPGDTVQGGVALRAVGELVEVHPFVYREVCTNGAIIADALESRRMQRVGMAAPSVEINAVLAELRLALRGCGHPSAFAGAAEAMRRATREPRGLALMAMFLAMRRDGGIAARLLAALIARFGGNRDTSAFGVINAVTRLAQETRDPERRWQLEELGGGMLALLRRDPKLGPPAAELLLDEFEVLEEKRASIDACA